MEQHGDLLESLEKIKTYSKEFSEFKVSDVKKSISSFTNVILQRRNTDELKVFLTQSSSVVTRLYSKLSERFRKFEREYIEELFRQWKQILECIGSSARARCCLENIAHMQVLVRHLRVSAHRIEQISILMVLCLYTEDLSPEDLNLENTDILVEIARLPPLPMKPRRLHTFLSYVNIDGTNIFTVRAIEVAPVDFELDSVKQKQEVWLDFNVNDKSIVFLSLSLKTKKLLCIGIVSCPQIKHYLHEGVYQLVVVGNWTLSGESDLIRKGQKSKIMFTCHVGDKLRVDSMKSHFNLSEYRGYDAIAAGQDKGSELESTIIPYHDGGDETKIERSKITHDRPDQLLQLNSAFSDFSIPNDMNEFNIATDWKWILNQQDNETEMSCDVLEHLQVNVPFNSLDVNCVSNEPVALANNNGPSQPMEIGTNRMQDRIVVRRVTFTRTERTSRKVIMSTDRKPNDRVRENDEQPRKRARLDVEQSPPTKPLIVEKQISAEMDRSEEYIQQILRRIKELEDRVDRLTQEVKSLRDGTTYDQPQQL